MCGLFRPLVISPARRQNFVWYIQRELFYWGGGGQELEQHVRHLKQATAALYLDQIASYFPDGNKIRLLEIGCGDGDFLYMARSRGFDVKGIEVSPHAVEVSNCRLGGCGIVVNGDLESIRLTNEDFDIVVFLDVIEHVRSPMKYLSHIYHLLKPGGIIFAATPSLDSWSARLLRRYWMEYKIEHLYYFNRHSLRLLLEKSCFVDVNIVPNLKVLSLDYIFHHFRRYPVPVLSPIVSTVRHGLPSVVACYPWKIVASGMVAVARKPSNNDH